MAVYADFAYYTDVFLGNTVSEADFPRLALRASSYLDYYTQGRAARNADMEAVKMACCALSEQYQMIDAARTMAAGGLTASDTAQLQSQTVGDWSKTYRAGGDTAKSALSALMEAEKQLVSTAQTYLIGTGLLYRGGRCCR